MNHQPCGFVDNQNMTIFIDDIKHHRLGLERLALWRGLKLNAQTVTRLDLGRRLGLYSPVVLHSTSINQLLQVTA